MRSDDPRLFDGTVKATVIEVTMGGNKLGYRAWTPVIKGLTRKTYDEAFKDLCEIKFANPKESPYPDSREMLEKALDCNTLYAPVGLRGKHLKVRRNGKTQTWKTRPAEFRIPIKFGLYGYGEITQRTDFKSLRIVTV